MEESRDLDAPSVQAVPLAQPRWSDPLVPGQRVLAVDVIRGFALLGVLLVNMGFFATPFQAILLDEPWWPGWLDRGVEFAVRALAEGKFYILFSLLFGLGMALQMQRAAERGHRFGGYYVRRLVVLLAFGVAHALLLWYGDILTVYAVLGFVLLLFRRRKDKTILIWAVATYVLPIVAFGALTGLLELARMIPEAAGEIERGFAEQEAEFHVAAVLAVERYARGSWADVFWQRLSDLGDMQFALLFMGPTVTAMFLVGLYVGRRRILHEPEAHLGLLRGLVYAGLPLGLLCNLGFAVGAEVTNPAIPTWSWWLTYALQCTGAPLLAFGYAAALVLLLRAERWQRRLHPLAAVGRMALTNYLLQSLICTTIFYSYGLGLFGRVGPAVYVPLALGIYAVQIPLSVWWLGRFRFGPLEWVWRTLTYGRVQPMRL